MFVLLTGTACTPRVPTARANGSGEAGAVLVDEGFDGARFDSGIVRDRCYAGAPWGGRSWGVEGSTFSRPGVYGIAAARFTASGHDASLWGRDDSGAWGFVRWIQGSAWADSNCGDAPWRRFRPIDTFGRRIELGLRVRRDRARLLHPDAAWVLFALNVWLSSPLVARQGDSLWGRKPLVMDLAVHHEATSPFAGLRNFEDMWAYHYQAMVGQAPAGTWSTVTVPLSRHIAAAVQEFHLGPAVERTLQITQVEFLIELRHAEGSARIDDFSLRSR